MKKSLVAVLALFLVSNACLAQIGFGVKGGYNITNVISDSAEFANSIKKSGFNFGIFLQFPVNDKFSIQTDVLFSGGGFTASVTGEPVYGKDTTSAVGLSYQINIRQQNILLNYISIPIMARYAFGPLSLQAGPQIGLLGRALVDDKTTVYQYSVKQGETKITTTKLSETDKKKDIQDFYKKVDFGVAAGLGGEWGRFQVTARYYTGLLNIANYGRQVHNTCISVSVGWRLSNDY